MQFARLPINKIMFRSPFNRAKFIFWLKPSEINLTLTQELWVQGGMEYAGSACSGAQETAGWYFSVTESSCFFVSWNGSSHVEI